jgi:hypothetical protein
MFPNLKFTIKKRDITKPPTGTLSINKAKKLLLFSPKHSLKIGVKKYVKYLIDNNIYKQN